MEWFIISLLSLSAILFLLSFFQKDSTEAVEKQVENMSIQLMQEIYYLKKKVNALEEEYMIDSGNLSGADRKKDIYRQSLTRDDVLAMYEEGYSVEDIASMTDSDSNDIEELLAN